MRTATSGESFATVFSAHHRDAVRLAYLLTSDAQQAEDVVSEAFAKVYVQWRAGRVDDVGRYLRRAVANTAKSGLRRRYVERREAARRSGDLRGIRRIDEDTADRDQVWQALRRLPDRQRAAVVLRYYEELSVEETADLLGVSTGTVKSQVSRGLERMRALLDASTPGGAW